MNDAASNETAYKLEKFVFGVFLALVFSLGFMQPNVSLFKKDVQFTELLFLITFALWAFALLLKSARFRWHSFYWLILCYLTSMVISTVFSEDPKSSLIKLLAEIYLLGLAILGFNLVRDQRRLRQVIYVWLSATGVSIAVGLLTIFLFYIQPDFWLLEYTRFHFGTLAPGNYPRLASTFTNANMYCNYLSVGFMFVIISRKLNWIGKGMFVLLAAGICICALFTISPGLGGIALSIGIWGWLFSKRTQRFTSFAALVCGIGLSLLFFAASVVSPNLHATAPFHIVIPVIEKRIDPSARVMTWIGAGKTFVDNPLAGRGLGQDACDVRYEPFSGGLHILSDAHNTLLNVAAQQGILGLLSLVLITFYLLRMTLPFQFGASSYDILRAGLGVAFISAFVYQGLTGSFEDARHLWVLIGLMLAVNKLSGGGRLQ